ncbi:hypothetical protein NFI96_032158 [Prochilodus magdalenae]|nr:hypothetical protein NFI96_032158 [Prochilodus magdalenae]
MRPILNTPHWEWPEEGTTNASSYSERPERVWHGTLPAPSETFYTCTGGAHFNWLHHLGMGSCTAIERKRLCRGVVRDKPSYITGRFSFKTFLDLYTNPLPEENLEGSKWTPPPPPRNHPPQQALSVLTAARWMNVYEDTVVRSRMEMSECSKTEDVYQTLHRPPAVSIPNSTHEPVRPRRLKTMLPIFNTLLLVAIVVMLGLHDWIMAFHPYPLRCHAQEAISQLDSYVHCRSMATDMHGLAMETPSNPSRKSVRALALFWLMRLPILFSSSWCQRSKSDFFDLNDGGLKALQPLTLCQRDTSGGTPTKQSLPALLMGMVELRTLHTWGWTFRATLSLQPDGIHSVSGSHRFLKVLAAFLVLRLAQPRMPQFAKEPRSTEVNNPQASGVVEGNKREELWRLHDDVFYLFWEAEGNCTAAVKFCEDRNSEVVTIHNSEGQNTEGSGHSDYGYMDFYFNTNPDLLARLDSVSGKREEAVDQYRKILNVVHHFLEFPSGINKGGVTTTHLNESLYHCPPDDENSDTMQGWVCESPQRSNFGFFHRKLFRDHFFLDTPTELPESSASTAVSVHSVKVYVITASVLSLLCPLRRLFTL